MRKIRRRRRQRRRRYGQARESRCLSVLASSSAFASAGVPVSIAPAAAYLSTALELVGSLLLLMGFRARLGASLLIAFLLMTTFSLHAFWRLGAADEISAFLKNISLIGGLLHVIAAEPDRALGLGQVERRTAALSGLAAGARDIDEKTE
eukprot:tig00020685_g12943.t1